MNQNELDGANIDSILWQLGDDPSILLDLSGYGPRSHHESFEAYLHCELVLLVFVKGQAQITVRDITLATWRVRWRLRQEKRLVAVSQLEIDPNSIPSQGLSQAEWMLRSSELEAEIERSYQGKSAQAIRLRGQGHSVGVIACLLGVSTRSVYRWIQKFRVESPQ